jgi:hypothetical protein
MYLALVHSKRRGKRARGRGIHCDVDGRRVMRASQPTASINHPCLITVNQVLPSLRLLLPGRRLGTTVVGRKAFL